MKNPDITITITGGIAKGKTALGHKLATQLRYARHVVDLRDEGAVLAKHPPEWTTPVNYKIGEGFTDPRRIKIVVRAPDASDERTCVYCGCTDNHACKGGCTWTVLHKFTNTGICNRCCTVEHLLAGDLILIRKQVLRRRGPKLNVTKP